METEALMRKAGLRSDMDEVEWSPRIWSSCIVFIKAVRSLISAPTCMLSPPYDHLTDVNCL
jgi:hypothetical protein